MKKFFLSLVFLGLLAGCVSAAEVVPVPDTTTACRPVTPLLEDVKKNSFPMIKLVGKDVAAMNVVVHKLTDNKVGLEPSTNTVYFIAVGSDIVNVETKDDCITYIGPIPPQVVEAILAGIKEVEKDNGSI